MGFQTRDVDGHCGWCEYGKGEEMVAVLCHLDVVPAGDGGTTPPMTVPGRGADLRPGGHRRQRAGGGGPVRPESGAGQRRPPASPGAPAGGVQRGEGLLLHPPLCGGRRRDPGDGLHPGRHVPHYQRGRRGSPWWTSVGRWPRPPVHPLHFRGTAHNVVPDRARAELNWPEEERSAACALTLDGVRVTETAEGLLVEAEGQSAHGSTPGEGGSTPSAACCWP